MKPENIKELIDIALKSVEDIKDQTLREKTYEIVLSSLLSKEKKPVEQIPVNKVEIPKEDNGFDEKTSNPILKIAGKFNVDSFKIKDYFEFNGGDIEILFPISLKSVADEQLYFTLILLTLKKIGFDEREIDSADLRKSAKLRGIKSLVNLSTNLKKYPEYVIHKHAKIGSISGSYKLTTEGYNRGFEIIMNVLNGQQMYQDSNPKKSIKKKVKKSELTNELTKLYEEGFFDDFKSVTDAEKELKKRGFFNKRQEVDSSIRKVLTQSKKLLLREKINGTWCYVKRR